MKEKGNQAGASEGDKILRTEKENQSSASIKVGEVLRRKREMWMSYEFSEDLKLLSVRRLNVARAGSRATTTKRKTKIVQKEVPYEVIQDMIKTPHPIIGEPLTDDQLAEKSKTFREAYARYKVRSVKVRAYYQALIDQYNAHGKAFDEEEVTDNEEEVTDDQ
jgi:hypothetical protein